MKNSTKFKWSAVAVALGSYLIGQAIYDIARGYMRGEDFTKHNRCSDISQEISKIEDISLPYSNLKLLLETNSPVRKAYDSSKKTYNSLNEELAVLRADPERERQTQAYEQRELRNSYRAFPIVFGGFLALWGLAPFSPPEDRRKKKRVV